MFLCSTAFSQYWEKVFDNRDSLWRPPANRIGQHSRLLCVGDTCINVTNLNRTTPVIFRSTDRGKNWDVRLVDTFNFAGIRTGIAPENILNLDADWPNIVAASDSNSYYFSHDGGLTWDRNKIKEPELYSKNSLKEYFTSIQDSMILHIGYRIGFGSNDAGDTFVELKPVEVLQGMFDSYANYINSGSIANDKAYISFNEAGYENNVLKMKYSYQVSDDLKNWTILRETVSNNDIGSEDIQGYSRNGRFLFAFGNKKLGHISVRKLNDLIIKIDTETDEATVVLDSFVTPTVSDGNIISKSNGIAAMTWRDDMHGLAIGYNRIMWETDDGGDMWFLSELNDVEHGALISLPGTWDEERVAGIHWFPEGDITYCNDGGQIFRYYPWPVSVAEEGNTDIYIREKPWVYPQPATGTLNFNIIEGGEINLIILDMTGRILIEQQKNIRDIGSGRVDVSTLAAGNYLLSIGYSDGRRISSTFVKE